jgi:hypothetical protein
VGVYLAVSQSYGSGGDLPTAQDFVNAYFNTGNVFSTIMFYTATYQPSETQRVLQIASLVDSNPNIKMAIEMGFDIGSSTDWAAVQNFTNELATHASVGWIGIEGEHTTYTGCHFGAGCPSIGRAWNQGNLSEAQLESYYSQFNTMASNVGLKVVHYYLTYGSESWRDTQTVVQVTQWPVCNGSAPCNPLTNQINEIQGGTSQNFIGISGGLSTNAYDAWNPSVNSGTYYEPWDNVISTYIQYAAGQTSGTRQLVLFETGGYQFKDDWRRSIFVTDLQAAMIANTSNWVYPN